MRILFWLLLLSVAVGAVWSSTLTRQERLSDVRAEAASLAAIAAASVDQYVNGIDAMAVALIRNPAVVQLNRQECNRLFAGLLGDRSLLVDLALSSPDGAILAAGHAVPQNVANAPPAYVRDAVKSARPVVSDLTITQISHKPAIVLAYPVQREDGGVVAVLSVGIDLLRLHTLFGGVPQDGSVIALTDRIGLVLARSLDPDRYVGTTLEAPPADRARPSTTIKDVDGVERIVKSSPVGSRGWLVHVGIPAAVVASRLEPGRRRAATISVLAVLGLALWSWRLAWRTPND